METLDRPPNFVARCPVKLFEAVGGSDASWVSISTAGELYVRPLGNAALYFQLRDLQDNQILFEHTMHKPDAFMVLAKRFFVIRLENGSFQGFGFADGNAAFELKKQIQGAFKPYHIQEYNDGERFIAKEPHLTKELIKASTSDKKTQNASFTDVTSYEALPKHPLSRMSSAQLSQEQALTLLTEFKPKAKANVKEKVSTFHSKWRRFMVAGHLPSFSPRKGLTSLSQMLGWKEEEIEIGYPTDVKHVVHIGWDGPSVGASNEMKELKPPPNFSLEPLQEFRQLHDAFSTSQWTQKQGLQEEGFQPVPPMPPGDFSDAVLLGQKEQKRKWKAVFRQVLRT